MLESSLRLASVRLNPHAALVNNNDASAHNTTAR
jgi:hypothetical protein